MDDTSDAMLSVAQLVEALNGESVDEHVYHVLDLIQKLEVELGKNRSTQMLRDIKEEIDLRLEVGEWTD